MSKNKKNTNNISEKFVDIDFKNNHHTSNYANNQKEKNNKNVDDVWYESLDIYMIGSKLLENKGNFVAGTTKKYLKGLCDTMSEDNKPVLVIYHVQGNHWVTFASIKINNEIIILFNASFELGRVS